jgi:hypothetical protein
MKFRFVGIIGLLAAVVLSGQDVTIVTLPDTQGMVQTYPTVWQSECQWILANRVSKNIQIVLSMGDMTGTSAPAQWQRARSCFGDLQEAGIAALPLLGNHDYDGSLTNIPARRALGYNTVFGNRFWTGQGYYGGNLGGSNANYYCMFIVGGRKLLVLALEYLPRATSVAWAKAIVESHPDYEVILVTHSYLVGDGSRSVADSPYSNDAYKLPETDANGQLLWDEFVSQEPNIKLVLCGHLDTVAYRIDKGVNGNDVVQVLNDFQDYPNGGNGVVGLITFHSTQPAASMQFFKTWAPVGVYDVGLSFTFPWSPGIASEKPGRLQRER